MGKSIVVTGANGFIGRQLTVTLEAAGHTVVPLGDERQLDIQDTHAVRKALAVTAPDVIFHLAAVSGPMLLIDHPEVVTSVNTVGTVNVLEGARSVGSRVVLASSVAGYSYGTPQDPLPASVYGATKRFVELLGRVYRAQYGLVVTSARIGSVYGIERKTDHVLHGMIDSALDDGVISYDPERWEPLVHVYDCARLLAGLVTIDAWAEEYDFVTTPRTHYQLAKTVRNALPQRPIRLLELPNSGLQWARVFNPQSLLRDTGLSVEVDVDQAVGKLVEARLGK